MGPGRVISKTLFFSMLICKFLSPSLCRSICPEWCECVSLDQGQHYLNCEWPHIPDAQVFLSFPIEVTRLTIKCKDDQLKPRSKYSPNMFDKFIKLKHLSIDNCHSETKTLPKSFANGLTELKSINLNDLSLNTVEKSSLAYLNGLERLSITTNLSNIPSTEFCYLKDLKYLNLSNNQLTTFVGCDSDSPENQIIIMDLGNNRISKFVTNSLHNFRGLRILRLSNNSLREIPSKLFEKTFQLKELYLDNNRISTINDLPGNLTVLDLSSNNLHMIPPSLARHANLHKLNLSRNYVDSNSPFVLDEMQFLLELDISYNSLQNVKGNFFLGLKNLTDLRLNANEIRHLELRCFQNLSRLKRLDLSNNKISSIKRQHFDGLAELNELNLHNNTLSTFDDEAFASILNLNSLDLSNNWLLDVPAAFYVLTNLRELNLSQNKITKIRKFVFDNLIRIRRLNLADNKITSLERNLFGKMKNLKRLDLSRNSIEVLQANFFAGCDSLQELFLQQNFLKNVAKVFSSLNSLRFLNVSENRIEKFELSFLPSSTVELWANNNQISRVTYAAVTSHDENEVKLRIVDFSGNYLTELNEGTLPYSLEYANFSHNRINSISDEFLHNMTDLSTIDLRNNFLTSLNQSSWTTNDGNNFKISLYLDGNNLACTCKLQWLKSLGLSSVSNGQINVVDHEMLSCSTLMSPSVVRQLRTVSNQEFLCTYKVLCIDTCLCCEFDACDCKNVCPDDCQCYYDTQNSINVVKCRNQTEQKAEHFRTLPMYATTLYLDGGNISQLQRNAFFGRYRLKQLFLNSSSISIIKSKSFSGLTSLELLDLSDNSLTLLTGDEFFNTPKIEALFLNGNRLQTLQLDAFVNLPNLKILTLHNNELQILPLAIMEFTGVFRAMTLANNPWKCDCDNRFNLQIWLPLHKSFVTDNQAIYCFENLTEFENSTVLSVLTPSFGTDVVKVNFWTFSTEINRTFCHPSSSNDDKNLFGFDNTSSDEKLIDTQVGTLNIVMIFAVVASGLILLLTVSLIVWKCRKMVRQKSFYNKYSAAPSVNSSNTAATTNGSDCNSPVPLLHYKVFISYSKADENFVINELLPTFEQSCTYSQICLLHRDFPTSQLNAECNRHLGDDIIKAMERSARVITVVSQNFIKNDWTHLHIRPAYQYLLRYKHCKLIMVVLENLPTKLDSMLAHYIRTNRCLFYTDPLFWQKLTDAVPDDNEQLHGSLNNELLNYSDMYGTIVPSRFV